METLPHEKGFHISWEQIHRDSRALAWRLEKISPQNGSWKAVLAVTRGGMVPAMVVARELDLRVVETISVKSYDHQVQSEAKILKSPAEVYIGNGDGILIVDDLVATGGTAIACAELLTENFKIKKSNILILGVIDLPKLGGSNLIVKEGYNIQTLISY